MKPLAVANLPTVIQDIMAKQLLGDSKKSGILVNLRGKRGVWDRPCLILLASSQGAESIA
jgi:hypothetical protein